MDIDMSALRALIREKDLSLDLVVHSIEAALLIAYHHTDGARPTARVELDRKSGHVVVLATEDGNEFEDTPAGFGRIAATTARQVLLQRRHRPCRMAVPKWQAAQPPLTAWVLLVNPEQVLSRPELGPWVRRRRVPLCLRCAKHPRR